MCVCVCDGGGGGTNLHAVCIHVRLSSAQIQTELLQAQSDFVVGCCCFLHNNSQQILQNLCECSQF